MQVIIKDDQGLGTALIMEDFSRAEIEDAKHSIRKHELHDMIIESIMSLFAVYLNLVHKFDIP